MPTICNNCKWCYKHSSIGWNIYGERHYTDCIDPRVAERRQNFVTGDIEINAASCYRNLGDCSGFEVGKSVPENSVTLFYKRL